MVDNKNVDKNVDNNDLNDEGKDLDHLNDDLDISAELSGLEAKIRNVAWDKIQEREQKIISETSGELDSLGAEIGLEWLNQKANEKSKDKVSEFFKEWEEELKVIDTRKEKRFVKKYKKMKGISSERPEAVKNAIESSVDDVLDEIYNWEKEKNPVARSLLRIVNMIMKTEK